MNKKAWHTPGFIVLGSIGSSDGGISKACIDDGKEMRFVVILEAFDILHAFYGFFIQLAVDSFTSGSGKTYLQERISELIPEEDKIRIKGLIRKVPANLLCVEEIEELYKSYSIQSNVDGSKKIMFGLMVYQGLGVGEIMRLQSHHIKLKNGKVFIKGTKRTNERALNLHAIQMAELQHYLKEHKFKESALFIEQKRNQISGRNVNNRIKYMFDQLRRLNPKVINAKHIRSSVITEWLRKNNLGEVQYLAGHKYVSSTERYQTSGLDDLQNELKHHHPMKQVRVPYGLLFFRGSRFSFYD